MSEWCQNKKCCYKRNQNQMRGSKGNKYYQSNKAQQKPKNSNGKIVYWYFNRFCSQGCFYSYLTINETAIFNIVPKIGKQIVPIENSWGKESKWHWRNSDDGGSFHTYYLNNKLLGEKIEITEEQYESIAHNSDDATRLANQLLSQAKVA